jgi:hypothetical protein
MSLKIAAEHLKSKGRGSDTELVHMTPGEIKGLRQLALAHGGDLTINPETGLPEAGFLSKILPVVAAAAATYFTAGAAAPALEGALAETAFAGYGGLMAGAGAGALIGGASAGLQGGDIGKGALFGGLGGALSGGLGAYDAAPVIEPTSTAEITAQGVKAGTLNPDVNAGLAGTTQYAPTNTPTGPFTPTELAQGVGNPLTSGTGLTSVTPAQSAAAMKELGNAGVSYGTQPIPGSMGSTYSGLGNSMTDMAKKAAILAAPGIGAQMGITNINSGQVPTGQSTSVLDRISPNFRAQEPIQPNPYYVAQYPDYKKKPYGMAGGGAIAFANRGIVEPLPRSSGADVGTYTDTDPNTAKLDAYNAALYRFNKANKKAGIKAPVQFKQAQSLGDIEEAATGGLMAGHSSLGGYSDGGRLLKGPGDGMSDSIPAQIGHKQPARLADGEFVVPADVVSHLGNGSTDAGAKKLYGMMDKIRSARTGKKKQAPEVKTDKYLPA